MAADIAHDLWNPLTVISGYLESLQDGELKPSPERFAVMQAEFQHLQHLVKDLRTLSLADSENYISIFNRLRQMNYLNMCKYISSVNLNVETENNLLEINIDPERMEQVLGHFVSNALRYTPEGEEISLEAKQVEERLNMSVQDNGSSIAPEILQHIFERSYRGDVSRNGNKSGPGLAIAKSIVELHGGKIVAQSTGLGHGSRFAIIFK